MTSAYRTPLPQIRSVAATLATADGKTKVAK
jgi:hypothetical protein